METGEIQLAPLVCPKCNQEFDFSDGESEYTCLKCGEGVQNLTAQFMYSRGYDAFFTGQLIFMDIPPKQRTRRAYAIQSQEGTELYKEAYSALQEASQQDLAESQRYKIIEIMAGISHLLMQSELVSPLEANYWASLMIEQVNRAEYVELCQKITQPITGFFNALAHLNWRRRRHQLRNALEKLDRKIDVIEKNIAFVSPPRVRRAS